MLNTVNTTVDKGWFTFMINHISESYYMINVSNYLQGNWGYGFNYGSLNEPEQMSSDTMLDTSCIR